MDIVRRAYNNTPGQFGYYSYSIWYQKKHRLVTFIDNFPAGGMGQ